MREEVTAAGRAVASTMGAWTSKLLRTKASPAVRACCLSQVSEMFSINCSFSPLCPGMDVQMKAGAGKKMRGCKSRLWCWPSSHNTPLMVAPFSFAHAQPNDRTGRILRAASARTLSTLSRQDGKSSTIILYTSESVCPVHICISFSSRPGKTRVRNSDGLSSTTRCEALQCKVFTFPAHPGCCALLSSVR